MALPARSLALVLSLGCAGEADEPANLSFVLAPTEVAAGDEIQSTCHSFTLANDAPIYVSAVVAHIDPGFHHSNWFYVPEDLYAGPDGEWPCAERQFDGLAAAIDGGALFAQSTQSTFDEQRFQAGAAIVVPERSQIIAQSHLLNATDAAVVAGMTVDVELLPKARVTHELQPMGFGYSTLEIPPQRRSRFVMDCAVGEVFADEFDRPADFGLYYSLAHYHGMGRMASAVLLGGQRDGEVLFETAAIGDPLGHVYDPPVNVAGMTSMRITCEYDNPSDRTVTWGLGDGEMCAVGFYTDAPLRLLGFAVGNALASEADGVQEFHGECRVLGVNP